METNCPHCGASLDGGLIGPELNSPYECDGETIYPYGKGAHWERQIGIEVSGVYDGILAYRCPDCAGTWPSAVGALKVDKKSKTTLYEKYIQGVKK